MSHGSPLGLSTVLPTLLREAATLHPHAGAFGDAAARAAEPAGCSHGAFKCLISVCLPLPISHRFAADQGPSDLREWRRARQTWLVVAARGDPAERPRRLQRLVDRRRQLGRRSANQFIVNRSTRSRRCPFTTTPRARPPRWTSPKGRQAGSHGAAARNGRPYSLSQSLMLVTPAIRLRGHRCNCAG